ncbi:MAG: hypothetical protein GXP44_01770 [bacterium]|nr:hypothetical protein [bacterium]
MDTNDNGQNPQAIKDTITDKMRKLTSALYRVTELYPDKEPIKWALRNSAVCLYIDLLSVMSDREVMSDRVYNKLLNSISEIIHALELASVGGFVLDINFEILKKEYIALNNLLKNGVFDFIYERKLLAGSEFEAIKEIINEASRLKSAKPSPQRQASGANGRKAEQKPLRGAARSNGEKRGVIMDFLAKNGKKTLKEIAVLFNGVSDKTVQRCLFDLVKSGDLKAEGEKRWRVYSIAKSR